MYAKFLISDFSESGQAEFIPFMGRGTELEGRGRYAKHTQFQEICLFKNTNY